jgi:hypothetical protein
MVVATGFCTAGTANALSVGKSCDANHASAFTVQLLRQITGTPWGQLIQPAAQNYAGGVIGQYNKAVSSDCRVTP